MTARTKKIANTATHGKHWQKKNIGRDVETETEQKTKGIQKETENYEWPNGEKEMLKWKTERKDD